jgi:hypothetical protein
MRLVTAATFTVLSISLLACAPPEVTAEAQGDQPQVATDGFNLDGARKEVFYWRVSDIYALTDGGFVFIDQIPEGITSLVGTPAQDLLLLSTFIRNEADQIVGIASEHEEFERPLTPAGKHDAIWTLMISGRGSLIAHEIEVSTEETRAFLERIRAMDGPWSGEFVAQGTIGPAENGLGVVIGGTGEFADARGYMMEENVYLGFDGTDYDVRTRLTFFLE